MTYSQDCVDLAKESEGEKLRAYQDPVGVWTIAYGHTGPEVHDGLVWTQEQADAQLAVDLQIHCEQMQALVKVPLTQGQTDALTDFTFNMGSGALKTSTLLRLLNMGQYDQVPAQLAKWVYAGGQVLAGLVARRKKEIDLWQKAS
ncbi:MAG TPA: lysozyme [Nitrospira sp.]|nr:lysozyme [Nitrospira sp.]